MSADVPLINSSINGEYQSRVPEPEHCATRILLAVTGLTPQVVTENLYALCFANKKKFIPTHIKIITTTQGRLLAESKLLDRDKGHYWKFLNEYNLQGQIEFSIDDIYVLRNSDGRLLDDLWGEEDLAAAADSIVNVVRELTADPSSALHVSISGSRNVMGVYLGMAMMLYGRPQDRVSQILVDKKFLSNDAFYYPPPTPVNLTGRDNMVVSTDQSNLTLCEIPIITLRHGLPDSLLSGDRSYTETIDEAKRCFSPAKLLIDFTRKMIICSDHEIRLPPQLFAWFAWMAKRRAEISESGGHVSWRDEGVSEGFLSVYQYVVGGLSHDYEEAARTLSDGMTKEFFDEKKSRVNSRLKEELGLLAPVYQIQSSGQRPSKRFGLLLKSIDITFVG